ncbi:MAG: hypothetical protein MUC92_10075 [Fimbriimonadaceae bacterium]|jgi:hypothetical protein|nr:hypothetical protein [Fimbriimonadaceae bacterium]
MIPPKSAPCFPDIVTGKKKPEFKSLALKILVGRVQMSAGTDPSEANVQNQIAILHEFFVKNESTTQADIAKLAA